MKVAWLIPRVTKGSGGHRTIIQNLNLLIDNGYECDIYVKNDVEFTESEIEKQINEFYMPCSAKVYKGWKSNKEYDIVFATSWDTVNFANKFKTKEKFYFIQDYEPWFFPMSDNYIFAENTYKEDYKAITIGKWLSYKLNKEFGMKTSYFDFCADLNIYKNNKNIKKEDAICCIFQPNKSRRCINLLLNSIKIINKVRPDIKIYLYGSEKQNIKGVNVENLGIVSPSELNKRYNKCKIGVSMSSSNPSRIPFEMMASGLPVVELYRENNLYDMPDDCVMLSESTPEALATTIISLYEDDTRRENLSKNSINYMQNYPLEKGYDQFISAFNYLLNNNSSDKKIEKLYKEKQIKAKKEYKNILLDEEEQNVLTTDEIINGYENENKELRRLLNESNNQINKILNSKRWKISGIITMPFKIFRRNK